ncbi:MAG: helix-turn-helix transcriptional regulator [Clostridia bacterium]|nr:helix-turn-helix transcriptional regulator [Clostridia bacterium]
MDVTLLVRYRIKQLLKEKNLPIHRLATYSGIPASTLKNILYAQSANPGIDTIAKICDGLEMSLVEFFSSVEFTDPWTISDELNEEKKIYKNRWTNEPIKYKKSKSRRI